MANTVKLFNPVLLPTGAKLVYTVPQLTKTIVRKLGFYNSGDSVVEMCVYFCPVGETESTTNLIMKRKIAAGESFDFLGAVNDVLEAGDTIRASASIDDKVNVRGSGAEIVNS